MKNFMKKIIVASFALAFLFSGSQNVFASSLWNGASNDCMTLSVANYTTQTGYVNPCWPLTSVNASQGDSINVRIYYHNSSDMIGGQPQTATNTRIILSAPTGGASSSHSFTAQIVSDQGNLSSSAVTVNLSSSQTLSFGSTRWYPNQSQSQASFINGQSGSEVINGSGLAIGSIAPGWNTQGSVVVSFLVGSTTQTNNCTISNFTANGGTTAYIQSGDSVNLAWSTNNCTSATISGPNGTISNSLNSSMPIYPTSSGTYTINAYGSNGSASPRTVYINVNNTQTNNCRITDFTVDNSTTAYIDSGDSVRIEWDTDDCTSATISGSNLNSSSLSGNRNVTLYNDATYTIYAYGNTGGSQNRTVRVYVDEDDNNNCYISNFTANGSSNAYIQSGNAVNFVWNTNGCTSVNVSGPGLNSYQSSGYQTIYPTYSGTYRITASSYNGSTPSRTVYVTVNPVVIVPPVYNNCAVTTVATNISQNSATLNGLVTNSTGASYFEYGTNVSMTSRTVSRAGSNTFTDFISGLSSNTIYYYRFVSQCGSGLSYGSIEVFRTLGAPVTNTIIRQVVQGTTVIGTESPIMLKIENRYQNIGIGDTVDYTVTYKNIGKSKLTKPVLQVVVPKGITLTNSSAGTYQVDTNTLTVPLMDLNPGDEGVVYLQGVVNSIDSSNAQIVTTAILVYTSPNGAQENAIAYVLNTPRNVGNVLGASAFWAGFWNMGLIGWLLLLILILLIVLLTRKYSGNKSVVHKTSPTGSSHTTTTTNY